MPGSAVTDLRNSYGAMFIGVLVNTMLFGLEIVQAGMYYRHYWNKDKKSFKIFIGFLLAMDTMSTILCSYAMYWYLVLNFGNIENLQLRVWAMNFQPLFSTIPSAAVQLYYARRVYLVSQSIICPIIVVPLIFGGALFAFFSTVKVIAQNANVLHTTNWLPCIWMGATVFADITITVTMCWTLYHKRTGFARTDSIIMALMIYTINSGLLLSTVGSAMTISFAVAPSNMIWLAFFVVAGKCYMNSLFAMLNTRDYVRDRSTIDNPDNAYNLTSIRIEPLSEAHGSKPKLPGVTVTVHHSTTSDFMPTKSDQSTVPAFKDPKLGDTEM